MGQAHSGSTATQKGIAGWRPTTLVIFGDSFSDGGVRGYGAGNALYWRAAQYPAEMLQHPMCEVQARFGSSYPFAELGFHESCFTDGLPWPYHLSIADVHNFAHGSGTTCQAPQPGLTVPDGFYPLRSTTGLVRCPETTVLPRGVAQQLQQAEELVPQEVWTDTSALFLVVAGANDYLYHKSEAIGYTQADAKQSPTVQNHRQILLELKRLGVAQTNIIVTGLPALDCCPGVRNDPEADLDWLRSQIEAVNECIADLGPRRWELDKLWREKGLQAESNDYRVYDRIQSFSGPEDLVKQALQEPQKPGWFDEYHPNLLGHQMIADSFARRFF